MIVEQPMRRTIRRGVARARRGAHARPERDMVVRVLFPGWSLRTYAYLCRGPVTIGDRVEVESPYTGTTAVDVVALGRQGYAGPLKRARRIG